MLKKIALMGYKLFVKLGRATNKVNQHRIWSNVQLPKYSTLFKGDICNVSGWEDSARDGSGRHYADFFPNCTSYTVTNYLGARGSSAFKSDTRYFGLNLELPLPSELKNRYDVVFNHTTLEHVFDIKQAVSTLCELSNDILIIVVPFMQEAHFDDGSYGDYWRFTPMAICKLCETHGVRPLVIASNDEQP
jgi:hypothetical protein